MQTGQHPNELPLTGDRKRSRGREIRLSSVCDLKLHSSRVAVNHGKRQAQNPHRNKQTRAPFSLSAFSRMPECHRRPRPVYRPDSGQDLSYQDKRHRYRLRERLERQHPVDGDLARASPETGLQNFADGIVGRVGEVEIPNRRVSILRTDPDLALSLLRLLLIEAFPACQPTPLRERMPDFQRMRFISTTSLCTSTAR